MRVRVALTKATERVELRAAKGRRPERHIYVSSCALRTLKLNPAVVFMSWRAGWVSKSRRSDFLMKICDCGIMSLRRRECEWRECVGGIISVKPCKDVKTFVRERNTRQNINDAVDLAEEYLSTYPREKWVAYVDHVRR